MAHTSHTGLISRAREFMERFRASRVARGSRREEKAGAAQLQLLEPRLREDAGADGEEHSFADRPLGSFNPMVVAVNLYTIPRRTG